ncbi:GTP-binding protein [Candidatus Parabeggiatoa sp. HSG14]|uniref:CobW family GTP-binding protein n=1 Tax=Candidatus Parabeggiatoa sp. HSG14 TaxID=3055593 RepID=UPI0032E46F2D
MSRENSHTHLPIHVITGFLGSGKTTLLNQLLHQPKMQHSVVIVNEFGEIGIDHLLIKATTEDMLMLEGGCICCSVRTDLLNTLEDLFHKRSLKEIPEFEQVLVETTGLADPAPILRTLINDPFIAAHYRLEVIVTTIDTLYGAQQLNDFDESVKQAALGNHLVLTKIDLVEAEALVALKQRLHHINPSALIHEIDLNQHTLEANTLFNTRHYDNKTRQLDIEHWLQADIYLEHQQTNTPPHASLLYPQENNPFPHLSFKAIQHDAYIKTFCIEYHEPLHWLTLERWIQQLTRLRGKDLLRIKGIAYTYETDLPVIIQGVQHILQPPVTLDTWPDDERRSQIVFITRNIEKTLIERVLYALIDSKTPTDVCRAALILLKQEPSGVN